MDMKKSLLFVCYGLGIGGIEKCLVNLINALPEARYDVDLLVMNPEYAMMPQIRRNVTFLDAFQYTLNTEFTMQEIRKRGGILRHLDLLLPYIDHRVRIKLGLPVWTKFRPLEKEYDIAVAYSQNGISLNYVIDKVTAKRKVLWYHNGAYEFTGKQYELDKRYYGRFDYIVAVSQDCAKVLRDKFPLISDKIVVLRNICDPESIRENARLFVPGTFSREGAHIVTVGRMTKEKGADLALEACRRLRAEGRKITWHWVGDGNRAADIRKQADALGLSDSFLPEGNQENPYPFILAGDIYVQPSYYEAYSTTVTEAKVLHRPMVVTDVGGMRDQLVSGRNALIVPVDAAAIADAVRVLLDDDAMRETFSKALEEEAYDAQATLKTYEASVFS